MPIFDEESGLMQYPCYDLISAIDPFLYSLIGSCCVPFKGIPISFCLPLQINFGSLGKFCHKE